MFKPHILSMNIVILTLVTNLASHQNINILKSIAHIEKIIHFYSRAEIETLKRAKTCLLIKP